MKKSKKRIDFSKLKNLIEYPDFLDVQLQSYKDFFQLETPPEKRDNEGLFKVFKENFPISDSRENFVLEFIDYTVDPPKYSVRECIDRGLTYSLPLKAKLRLICNDEDNDDFETIEQEVFLGNIPYMTGKGSFVINGAERVIVSQLHRSPGVFFAQSKHTNGTPLYSARIIPFRGSWIEFATDVNNVMYAYIDRKKKFPITTLLRAIGYGSDKDILDIFQLSEEVEANKILYKLGFDGIAQIAEELSKLLTIKMNEDEEKKNSVKPNQILFGCTGTIGETFPTEKIKQSIPSLIKKIKYTQNKYLWIKPILPILLVSIIGTAVLTLLQSALPLDLVRGGLNRPGLNESLSSFIIALQLGLLLIFQWPIGNWLSGRDVEFGLRFSMASLGIGSALLAFSALSKQGLIIVLISQIPLSIGLAAFLPTATESIIQKTPHFKRGLGMALLSQCFAVSAVFAPIFAGRLMDMHGNALFLWWTISICCFLSIIIINKISSRDSKREDEVFNKQ